MSDATKAVFLSYASQDAEAAKRICEALRAAGVEVWFDQSELVGGDAWDQKIRKQIRECALLIPIISKTTQGRREAYFRLEWKLADERTHLMARGTPYLLPVTIDETTDRDALVPDSFLAVQWTKAPGGEVPAVFGQRVKKLLAGVGASLDDARDLPPNGRRQATPLQKPKRWLAPVIGGAVVAVFALVISRPWEKAAVPANATKSPAAAPAGNTGSKPEVAALLARVRGATAKIDLLHTELDTMEGLLEQAAKLDPADAAIWAQWAQLDCLFLDKRYDHTPARRDAARRHVAQAAGLDAEAPAVRLAQAMVMRRLADDAATTAEATKILQRLLTEIPTDGRVPLELGWLAFDLARPEASLDWFARAAQVPGYGGPGHFARARMLVYSARTDQAGSEFDRALESEHSAEVLLWKAYILTIWNGDVAAARRALAEVPPQFFVEDMPAATRYYVALLSRNYDQALAAARAVPHDYLQSIAYSGPTGYFAGNALALAGKTAAAELEWRSALATVERRLAAEPNDRGLMEHKALLQAALGNREAGRKTWQAARELYGDADATNYAVALRVQLQTADEAFAWLNRTVTAGENTATAAQLRLDPVYDPIRSDPRFPALLARAEADPRLSPNARTMLTEAPKPAPSPVSGLPSPANPPPADSKSVAVLAFANLSDDKANEYFSDGISEELLNVLAKVPGLKVTARTSSFHFKGKDTPIPEIARQLGVAYVIEGSVRKAGDKVRITAQLIKAADGFHVWSDTFTRDLKDIFAVQDEIAGLIAKNLELKLGAVRFGEVGAAEIEAYRLYWEARQAWNRRNPASYDQAEALLNRALELAPRFAKAHAALADVWELRGEWDDSIGIYEDRDGPAIRRLLAKVDEALALDPQCAEAYASRGNILGGAWQFPAAETAFRTAIALNPNFATAHQWLGRELMTMGRLDEALAELKRAAELDPLSQRILDNYAWALRHAGRYSEALSHLDRALALQPDAVQARSLQAAVLADLGRGDEALAALRAVPDDVTFALNFRLSALGRLGRKADIERLLPGIRDATPRDRCLALALLGRTAEALATLKPGRIFASDADLLLFEPGYDPLRSHPEWNAAMAAIGFTDAHARAQAWRAAHPPEKLK